MKLFELYSSLGLDTAEFDKNVDTSTQKGKTMQGTMEGAFKAIKTAITVAGIAVAVKEIAGSFTDAAAAADTVDKSSQKLGLSRQAYQEWGYVLSQNGASIDTFGVAMKTLQTAMVQGTTQTDAALKLLGLSAKQLKTMSPEDALAATITAFQKMPEGAEKSAAAVDLFGKQGMELLPTLNQTAESTEALKEEANDLGLVLGDDAVDAGVNFTDAMDTLNRTLDASKTQFITGLMPAVTKIIDKLTPLFAEVLPKLGSAFGKVLDQVEPLVETLVNGFADILTWIGDNAETLIPIIEGVSGALLVWNGVQAILNITMAANPIGAVIKAAALLYAGVSLLTNALGNGSEAVRDLNKKMSASIDSISDFKGSMSNLKPTLSDVNDLLSSSGRTVGELDSAIQTSEDAITEILSTALQEHRDLRQSELDDIRQYNEDILALNTEKLQLYRDQQVAELQKIYLEENTMTQEQAAQRMVDAQAAYDATNAVSEEAYTAQLVQIENFYKTRGELGSQSYLDAQQAAKASYDQQLIDNETYYNQSLEALTSASAQWTEKDAAMWAAMADTANDYSAALKDTQNVNATNWDAYANSVKAAGDRYVNNFSIMWDNVDADAANAALSMVLTAKSMGADVDSEALTMVENMLSTFATLPPSLEDSGKNALLGLIGGMEDQIPELGDTSNDTAAEIVNKIKSVLGISSPSTVMKGIGRNVIQGLEDGMNEKKESASTTAATIGTLLVDTFKTLFGIHSPSKVMHDTVGTQIVQGIADGIYDSADKVDNAIKSIMPTDADVNAVLDITRNVNILGNIRAVKTNDNESSDRSTKQRSLSVNPITNIYANSASYAELERIQRRQNKALVGELSKVV